MISSPYDVEARYAKKQTTSWIGYKVHFTENCEEYEPHLITRVETTPAPIADAEMTSVIHEALQEKQLLPTLRIVDTGYLDAGLLVVRKQEHGVELLGPTRADHTWQAQAGQGFDASSFGTDWEQQQAMRGGETRRSTPGKPGAIPHHEFLGSQWDQGALRRRKARLVQHPLAGAVNSRQRRFTSNSGSGRFLPWQ